MASIHSSEKVALQYPVNSGDNEFLAVLTSVYTIRIIALRTGQAVTEIQFPSNYKPFLSNVRLLKWAPETSIVSDSSDLQSQTSETWLLLAGGNRAIQIQADLPIDVLRSDFTTQEAVILADYEFESQYGDIVIADFVFDHNQALIVFEMNVHASLISFGKMQRDDIPSVKSPDFRSFVHSTNRKYFALLLRSKGQDQIAVFSSATQGGSPASIFSCGTTDAQGIKWSPHDDPLLVVWDSAAYGPSLFFFTALGHPLKRLNLTASSLVPSGRFEHGFISGITNLNWKASAASTSMLTIGFGSRQLLIRTQDHSSMHVNPTILKQHNSVIDGSQTFAWRQTVDGSFEKQAAVFETPIEPSDESDMIQVNADASLVVSRMDTLSRVIWIWSLMENHPIAMISFRHDIKQLLWHPSVPNVLAIVTSRRNPSIYMWHHLSDPPVMVSTPFREMRATTGWTVKWMAVAGEPQCPLLIANKHFWDIGLVTRSNESITFESVVRDPEAPIGVGEEDSGIETPSKPGRASVSSNRWHLNGGINIRDPTADIEEW